MLSIRRSKLKHTANHSQRFVYLYFSIVQGVTIEVPNHRIRPAERQMRLIAQWDPLHDRIEELARREEALIAREIAVSSRESEVVTVLAEVLKQKSS